MDNTAIHNGGLKRDFHEMSLSGGVIDQNIDSDNLQSRYPKGCRFITENALMCCLKHLMKDSLCWSIDTLLHTIPQLREDIVSHRLQYRTDNELTSVSNTVEMALRKRYAKDQLFLDESYCNALILEMNDVLIQLGEFQVDVEVSIL